MINLATNTIACTTGVIGGAQAGFGVCSASLVCEFCVSCTARLLLTFCAHTPKTRLSTPQSRLMLKSFFFV